MKLKIYLILCSFVFFSCNPFLSKSKRLENKCERKVNKLIYECSDFFEKDTILKNIVVEVPEMKSFGKFKLKNNFDFKQVVKDKKIARELNREFKNYYILKDSLIINDSLATIKIFYNNGEISYYLDIPKRYGSANLKIDRYKINKKIDNNNISINSKLLAFILFGLLVLFLYLVIKNKNDKS